jgi:hypothetical protein
MSKSQQDQQVQQLQELLLQANKIFQGLACTAQQPIICPWMRPKPESTKDYLELREGPQVRGDVVGITLAIACSAEDVQTIIDLIESIHKQNNSRPGGLN